MQTALDWEVLSAEAGRDRRKEKRIPLAFPIEVCGFDASGHFFSERTQTTDISEEGCRFCAKAQPEPGEVVAVRLVSRESGTMVPKNPLLFQIAWVAHAENGWVVGAFKLQPENVWNVAFPSAQKKQLFVV